MDNKTIHIEYELPSSRKLLLSSGIALGVAIIVLVLFVLPAEYGIDLTGVGRMTGLKNMGEIKKSLEAEQMAADTSVKEVPCDEPAQKTSSDVIDVKSDTLKITLKPGEAAELKLVMDKDATVDYVWKVDRGHLNYDVHGDKKGLKYYGYTKGKGETSDSGELKAAFKGSHGWFWRNRSKEVVKMTLIVKGAYEKIKRVV